MSAEHSSLLQALRAAFRAYEDSYRDLWSHQDRITSNLLTKSEAKEPTTAEHEA